MPPSRWRRCTSPAFRKMAPLRADESIRQSLVIAFVTIVGDEFVNRLTHRALAEQDHPL